MTIDNAARLHKRLKSSGLIELLAPSEFEALAIVHNRIRSNSSVGNEKEKERVPNKSSCPTSDTSLGITYISVERGILVSY
jgi:hypothetical protein